MDNIIQILTTITASLGWALLASMAICQTVLMVSCFVAVVFGENKISFCASGHMKAFFTTTLVCWVFVLIVSLLTT